MELVSYCARRCKPKAKTSSPLNLAGRLQVTGITCSFPKGCVTSSSTLDLELFGTTILDCQIEVWILAVDN